MPGGIEQGITGSAFANAYQAALGRASQPPPPLPIPRPNRDTRPVMVAGKVQDVPSYVLGYAGQGGNQRATLPPIGPSGGPSLTAANRPAVMRPGSPSWWSNPMGAIGGAFAGSPIMRAANLSPAAQQRVGGALMSTPAGRGMVLRNMFAGSRPLMVAQAAAPVMTRPQIDAHMAATSPGYNPSNHSNAQMAAVASGKDYYTGSDGGMQPTHAMNGKLRNTY